MKFNHQVDKLNLKCPILEWQNTQDVVDMEREIIPTGFQ